MLWDCSVVYEGSYLGTYLSVSQYVSLPHCNDTSVVIHLDGFVQDYSNSCALAMELLLSYTKPLIWSGTLEWHHMNVKASYYTPRFNEVDGGYTGITLSVCPSVRLSVCGQNRVRSVSSTILIGSISYLHILSSNFRRCVACNARFKIKKIEILANF